MKNVSVKKETLLRKIKENLKKHMKDYKEAMKGYKKEAIIVLNKMLVDVRKGKKINSFLELKTPEHHKNDYERVIGMLEMHEGELIELSDQDYRIYLMDQWDWKHSFDMNTKSYIDK